MNQLTCLLLEGKWQTLVCLSLDPMIWKQLSTLATVTPSLADITYAFMGITQITRPDGSSFYFCMILDCESSYLTTVNSTFRWLQFVCLPFSITCTQAIFQHVWIWYWTVIMMHSAIANYILLHSKEDVEHNQCLCKFMCITHDYCLVLNSQRRIVKATSVKFVGCVYDAKDVQVDPKKLSAIHTMSSLEYVTQLQEEFLGWSITLVTIYIKKKSVVIFP